MPELATIIEKDDFMPDEGKAFLLLALDPYYGIAEDEDLMDTPE